MTDNERKIRLVEHTVPEGEAKWCNRASALSIPGRPELGLFPSILTWHYGNCRVEHPYVRTVSYFPDISSLRDNPETNELQMKYPSVHDSDSWIAFTVAKDRPLWSAEKFLRGESVGLTSGPPGDPFFVHLALNPIPEDEKHLYRDWPSEEILAIYRELRPEEEAGAEDGIWDLREFCRRILDSVQKTEGWGRAEAASILCEMLRKEAEPAAS